MRKLLPLSFMLFTLQACLFTYDPPRGYIELRNYSDQPIYVYSNYKDTLPLIPALSLFHISDHIEYDAWGNEISKPIMHAPEERIDAYSYGKVWVGGTRKKPNLGYPGDSNNKLYLFFLKEDVMRNHTWEEIWRNQMYEKKDSVTEGEMERTLWRYTYYPE